MIKLKISTAAVNTTKIDPVSRFYDKFSHTGPVLGRIGFPTQGVMLNYQIGIINGAI